MPGDPIDSYLAEMRALVDEHGWALQYVPATDSGPPFAYTVGLFPLQQRPEILLYGLPRELSHRVCHEAVGRLAEEGSTHPRGQFAGILADLDVVFLPIDAAREVDEFAVCRRLWPGADFRAVQLVWPDREGRYPWEPGCDPGVVAAQPLRGTVRAEGG